MNEQERQRLLALADDELVLGWRDSEWTGIAPVLEEDVAFSSIAQNEIGHARAVYQLLAADPDALAFDRPPEQYRCAPLVQLRLVPDWARTIARRVLYEAVDALRLARLRTSTDEAVRGLATKIDREEAYHRLHAQLWRERLADEPCFAAALDELWPYALAMTEPADRKTLCRLFERTPDARDKVSPGVERGEHDGSWPALWEEMTVVRRSVPGAAW